ncbi:hypothetical protein MBLNU459_g4576t1 [Dothideomycetes sp. NU459]
MQPCAFEQYYTKVQQMPVPANGTNATSRIDASLKPAPLNIGKQTGLYDTANVRQKVRKWQVNGGGVATGEDVITVEYDEEENAAKTDKRTPKAASPRATRPKDKVVVGTDNEGNGLQSSPTKTGRSPPKPGGARTRTQREIDTERKAWVRRRSKSRNEALEQDLKHVGAPKKRVVSDGHWRTDRSPPKNNEEPLNTPKYTVKRTIIRGGEESAVSDKSAARKDDDGIRVRPMRPVSQARSRSREYTTDKTVAEKDDDGIRVRPMRPVPRTRSRSREHTKISPSSKSDNDRSGDARDERRRTPRPLGKENRNVSYEQGDDDFLHDKKYKTRRRRRDTPPASEVDIETSEGHSIAPDDSISKVDGQAPRRTRSPLYDERPLKEMPSARLRKTERKAPQKQEDPVTITPPKVFGNRIEAWLGSAPDPFVEVDNLSRPESRDRVSSPEQNRSGHGSRDRKKSARLSTTTGSIYDDAAATEKVTGRSPIEGSRRRSDRQSEYEDYASSTSSSVPPTEVELPHVATSKHSPGLNLRKRFPTTGKPLSTIASVNTLRSSTPSEASDQGTIVPDVENQESDNTTGLKRRLTRHDDLLSVLSLPRAESKSLVSARSIRTSRTRLEKATVQDILGEFTADESKYQRELRTLVDGVIPVLLSCVLSKSDSTVAAGLFGRTANGSAVTQPIVDMGVALERLKSHHKRAPQSDVAALVAWAQGATKIYTDYLKAWRMGFQDVVVNLAPADESMRKEPGWDEGLPRNQDGDLLNGDGERVDVAFLLKRPLVRLKYLAKTFKGINFLAPTPQVATVAEKYQQLVIDARKRSNEERARLEDEAAAGIDPTRARDPRSLAPLSGVSIDTTRCVRARDYFDLNLRHSSGQQLDCKVEMVLRDDAPDRGSSGDVLVCEISDTGRWLLFPPIRQDMISARNGKTAGELIVMLRGRQSDGLEWHELLSLHANELDASPEWLQMLGLQPIPPSLSRQPSFLTPSYRPSSSRSEKLLSSISAPKSDTPFSKSRTPSPKEIEIPIGEQAKSSSKRWTTEIPSDFTLSSTTDTLPPSSRPSTSRQQRKPVPTGLGLSTDGPKSYSLPGTPLRGSVSFVDDSVNTKSPDTNAADTPTLKRSKAKRNRSSPALPASPASPTLPREQQYPHRERNVQSNDRPTYSRTETDSTWTSSSTSSRKKSYSVWLPSSTVASDESESDHDDDEYVPITPTRPQAHRRTSSVPSTELPSIPKLRKGGQPDRETRAQSEDLTNMPSSAPAKLQKRRKSGSGEPESESPSKTPKQQSRFSIPSFTPNFLKRHRRSSSPLKHEYEPSTATESSSDSDSFEEDDDASITSESSEESMNHLDSIKSPELPLANQFEKQTPPESLVSLPENTISPSQSASQAPYRTVPQQNFISRVVASIFSWSDRGLWESLHAQECSIVITPGLIEAFDMEAANAVLSSPGQSDTTSPSARGVKPLVAFELTPLVPLRRGTALDISIRSPPTVASQIRTTTNVMFRTRSPEECEGLYGLINQARINNPTYIALQNARGPFNESTWAAAMDRRNSARAPSNSWFHLPSRRSSTYRSKGSRAPSIAKTDSSIGTMNSAFSALRRFSGSNRFFDIAKSTITSQEGSRSTNSESLSSGSSTPMVFDPRQGTPLGITNAKIRLYIRETSTKWRDMGSARLTIMLPPRPAPNVPASPRTTGMEKRILVYGKTQGETLLDVTLGESCFERVARTGIAVSVWEENTGPNGEIGQVGASGGVMSSRSRTYMIQMKSERDCAYTFTLVGKLRY